MIDTNAFISALTEEIGSFRKDLNVFYDRADDIFPRVVVDVPSVTPLYYGDLALFDIKVDADDKEQDAGVVVNEICDLIRNKLEGRTICREGVFSAHFGFENTHNYNEKEDDIVSRTISFSARIFYL